MAEMLSIALKEWSVICRALIEGRQSLLVRKGGIAETSGAFRLEATRFLLYPTFVHQQTSGVRDDARPMLETVLRDRPAAGIIRIEAWCEVTGVYQIRDLLPAHLIAHLHLWSDDAIEKRYHYRAPGVDVLAIRVHRLPTPIEIVETPEHLGCKSWVPLEQAVAVEPSPVLSDAAYHDVIRQLDTLLRPTALA